MDGEWDFDEDEELPELPFLEVFGRTTTSWGWLDDRMGMRVIVGPVLRWREAGCFLPCLLVLEVELLLAEHSSCLLLPQLAHGGGSKC